MTRREEIEYAAMQVGGVHPDWDVLECFRVGYKEGSKWADRTMLARICEWLENHDMTEHIGVIYLGACSINFDKQGLIDALCKAMEE